MPVNFDKLAMILVAAIVLAGGFGYSYILIFRTDQYREWEYKRWGFDIAGSKGSLRFLGVLFLLLGIFFSGALIKLILAPSGKITPDQPNAFASWVGFVFGVFGIIVSAQLLFPEKTAAWGHRPLLERWQAGSTSRTVAGVLLLLGSSCLVIASAMLFFGGKIL